MWGPARMGETNIHINRPYADPTPPLGTRNGRSRPELSNAVQLTQDRTLCIACRRVEGHDDLEGRYQEASAQKCELRVTSHHILLTQAPTSAPELIKAVMASSHRLSLVHDKDEGSALLTALHPNPKRFIRCAHRPHAAVSPLSRARLRRSSSSCQIPPACTLPLPPACTPCSNSCGASRMRRRSRNGGVGYCPPSLPNLLQSFLGRCPPTLPNVSHLLRDFYPTKRKTSQL
jgi:hypothetical protein